MSFGDLLTREQSTHLLAGATAGLCVEVGVYPLDTMKTRLQSAAGTVRASCGRLHLFAGLPAVLVCSAPSGAAFFYAYEMCKQGSLHAGAPMWLSSMAGAGAGEITSLILRVPFENVKQRTQSRPHHTVRYVFSEIIQAEVGFKAFYDWVTSALIGVAYILSFPGGCLRAFSFVPKNFVFDISIDMPIDTYLIGVNCFQEFTDFFGWGWRGLYRGFLSTMFRELPSSLIQFPVWEFIKKLFAAHNRSKQQRLSGKSDPSIKAHPEDLTKAQFTFCGFVAGAVAGAFTTPVDVAKTRIMLADKDSLLASGRILTAMRVVYCESGILGLFAGIAPRMGYMSIGGALFLGLYDITKSMWADFLL